MNEEHGGISLRPVDKGNWRPITDLEVSGGQRQFVSEPSYYLALCCYEGIWHPLAIYLNEHVIGLLMWAVDPADGSCWLGGFIIDHRYQGQGYGRQAILAAVRMLHEELGHQQFALSYLPSNEVARHLYRGIGFNETDEWEEDEVVARLSVEALAE